MIEASRWFACLGSFLLKLRSDVLPRRNIRAQSPMSLANACTSYSLSAPTLGAALYAPKRLLKSSLLKRREKPNREYQIQYQRYAN